jgi:hypothetical protein
MNKMMKSLVLTGSLALGVGLAPAAAQGVRQLQSSGSRAVTQPTAAQGAQQFQAAGNRGVQGTVFVIDGNKNRNSQITTGAGTVIQIEFTFPPGEAQGNGNLKSSDPTVVAPAAVSNLDTVNNQQGAGLAALLLAKKKGKSTVTFTINIGKATTQITSEVTVD